ncbi:MAG: biotin/lipoyl-containing protein, partial [Caldimonas sp.]
YGFLSENEGFARDVEAAGIVFVGPKHASIAAMGDKIESKKLAAKAKVNTIPGHNAAIDTAEHAVEIAKGIGYPVMIKASAGGGGKGLRVAWTDTEAFEGYTSCRNEARNSFGDDRVFIEKFVEEPRHIEIQVLGDAHGHCVYLWERECSIQRRHQKVIEEAPSPFLDDATRKAMGEQAVALAKAVDYQSAGTVEFVVGKDKSFFFLEMNTRLQVEHPVTECITGLDLVEQMIRVAAGEALSFTQAEIRRDGWAIECRINAEDPFRGFLPSTGRLVTFQPPLQTLHAAQPAAPGTGSTWAPRSDQTVDGAAGVDGVRVDTGVYEGGVIPMAYDSMICKLIVHGRDRTDAIGRMREALNAFVIRGIASNIPFQSALLSHPRFVSGQFNTGFIAEEFPQGFSAASVQHAEPDFLLAVIAALNRRMRNRSASISGQLPGHELRIGEDFVIVVADAEGRREQTAVTVRERDAAFDVTLNGRTRAVALDGHLRDAVVQGRCDGVPFSLQVARVGLGYRASHNGAQVDARVFSRRAAELYALMPVKARPDMSKFLLSPMPGLLVDVAVVPGQSVRAGERLAVIEAMKMENILLATQDRVVSRVAATKGETLSVDQVIVEFE